MLPAGLMIILQTAEYVEKIILATVYISVKKKNVGKMLSLHFNESKFFFFFNMNMLSRTASQQV